MVNFIDNIKSRLSGKKPKAQTATPKKDAPKAESKQSKPAPKQQDKGKPSAKKEGESKSQHSQQQKPRSKNNRNRKPRQQQDKPLIPKGPKPEIEEHKKWDPTSFVVEPEEGKTRFHDLDLSSEIMHSISDMGWKYCTPIQAEILPSMLSGQDALGRAQTGTGKTAAFLIRIFTQLDKQDPGERQNGAPRALILAPTRELAIQIEQEARDISKYSAFRSMAVFGGMDYQKQKATLRESPIDVLVATPGRLLDYNRSRDINLKKVEILVIDEADRMLDMGFVPDVRTIVRATPFKEKRQTLFFSATFNDAVMRLAESWTENPNKVEIEPEKVASEQIKQVVYLATAEQKRPITYNVLKREDADRVLIFSNRRDSSRRICEMLQDYGFQCALLSGEVDQSKRIKTLDRFKNGEIKVIVATDVAGRGIHVDNVTHVINWDLPTVAEDYVHRIGRTGRAGEDGTSISFASEEDAFYLPEIEEYLGEPLKCVYPEDVLLDAPAVPPSKRKPKSRSQGGRGGQRQGGGSRGGNRNQRSGSRSSSSGRRR